ncbi:hypothetical protein O3P69_010883 [Scylla paramamosain]|uniref:Uncharacterized protein n=1 Tax=Scylla paramamosain TaxID=85552 RepID=A0AAW0TIM4_SCYPA
MHSDPPWWWHAVMDASTHTTRPSFTRLILTPSPTHLTRAAQGRDTATLGHAWEVTLMEVELITKIIKWLFRTTVGATFQSLRGGLRDTGSYPLTCAYLYLYLLYPFHSPRSHPSLPLPPSATPPPRQQVGGRLTLTKATALPMILTQAAMDEGRGDRRESGVKEDEREGE